MNRYKRLFEYEDYVGHHQAPTNDGFSAPLYDVTSLYPEDIYTHPNAWHFYGHGGSDKNMDKESINIIRKYHNKPNATLEVYRAVPKGVTNKKINKGDWVTINRKYAEFHGDSWLDGEYDIISQKVKAKEIWTDANSIHEWGYDK